MMDSDSAERASAWSEVSTRLFELWGTPTDLARDGMIAGAWFAWLLVVVVVLVVLGTTYMLVKTSIKLFSVKRRERRVKRAERSTATPSKA